MPRTKEQFEAMRKATNEKILSASIELFSKKGVAGTGVQEIADLAGISIGSLYRHYKTKDDVFDALVQSGVDGLKEIGALLEQEPLEVIKWWTKDILNDITKDDDFVRLMHIMSPSFLMDQSLPSSRKIMAANEVFQGQLADLFAKGQDQGFFHQGDALGQAQFFLTIINGLSSMKLVLQERFIVPCPSTITAFLIKEEYNHYE